MMFIFELFSVIIAAIGSVGIGSFTLAKNSRSATNRLFFIFASSIAVYNVLNFLALQQQTDAATLLWIRTVIAFAYFINLAFFLFVYTFPKKSIPIPRKRLVGMILVTLLLSAFAYTPYVFSGVKPHTYTPIAQPGILLLFIHSTILLAGGFLVLLRKYLQSKGIEKTQLLLLLLATVSIFLPLLITNFLLVNILQITIFVGLLPLYSLLFVMFISYAVIKHRFFAIRLILARSVAYSILLIIVGLFYSGALFIVSTIIIQRSSETVRTIVSILLALFIAISFQRLQQYIVNLTKKYLFRSQYSTHELIARLTKIMATTLDLDTLTRLTLNELIATLQITQGAFIVFDNEKMYTVNEIGYAEKPLYQPQDLLLLDSLTRVTSIDDTTDPTVKDVFTKLAVTTILPLQVKGEHLGVVILGEKKNGESLSNQDYQVLEIFTPEISVALQNARAYEQIKQFNVKLTEEVNNATNDLRNANKKLQQLDKLKDDFVSIASHELRTPMTAIKSYLWMALNKKKQELSPDLSRYLNNAYISVDRLISLVNDMLNVSRIEEGRISLILKPTDMIKLSDLVVDEVLPKAMEKQIKILVKESNIPQVVCDDNKIHEVLLNLIGNALKFTPQGGEINVSFRPEDQLLAITVSDTGAGINSADLSRLFAKFGRLANSYVAMAESSGGTGLGLYISKLLVELHKGTIKATSEGLGKGSQFTFTLPIVDTPLAQQLIKETPPPSPDAKQLEHTTIRI